MIGEHQQEVREKLLASQSNLEQQYYKIEQDNKAGTANWENTASSSAVVVIGVEGDGQSESELADTKPPLARGACRHVTCCRTGLFLLLVIAIGVGIAISQLGLFDSIDRDIIIDDNGNAVEPNTGIKFPLVINSEVDGKANDKKSRQHLIGMLLKVEHALGMNMKVFVLGYYVNWDIAKDKLKKWKGKKMDIASPDPELVELLSDGRSLPGTMKYVMTMSVTGSQIAEAWWKDLLDIIINDRFDPAKTKEIESVFKQWVKRSLHPNDRFAFSWDYPASATTSGDEQGIVEYFFNDKQALPTERSNEMIRALVRHELIENKGFMVNLLDTLWH